MGQNFEPGGFLSPTEFIETSRSTPNYNNIQDINSLHSEFRSVTNIIFDRIYRYKNKATCKEFLEAEELSTPCILDIFKRFLSTKSQTQICSELLGRPEFQHILEIFLLNDLKKCDHQSDMVTSPLLLVHKDNEKSGINKTKESISFKPLNDANLSDTSWRCSKRFYFLCAIFSVIFLTCLVTGITYVFSRQKEYQSSVDSLQLEKFEDQIGQSTVVKKQSEEAKTICRPEDVSSQKSSVSYIRSISLDFSQTVLDFCLDPQTTLIIDKPIDNDTPKILCPERVLSLEIISLINSSDIKRLLTEFCAVKNVSFVGSPMCLNKPTTSFQNHHRMIANRLEYLNFEKLYRCANIYEMVLNSTSFTNLLGINFRCVTFDDGDFPILEKILVQSNNFSTIVCEDEDLCDNFNFNSSLPINIVTKADSCEE